MRKVTTFTQRVVTTGAEQLSERGRDYLERANSTAARMQKLIEDLLTFSRVATHGRSFAPVDLGQLTAEVLEDLETTVEQSRAAVLVGALPTIYADELQMRQLIQNLLTDAMKFRREATTPEIAIDGVQVGATFTVIIPVEQHAQATHRPRDGERSQQRTEPTAPIPA